MADHAARNYLTDKQVELLLKPIHPQRVLSLKGLAYVAGHDIRAELNRVFGFCRWSEEILHQHLICENEAKTSKGAAAWFVVYNSRVRLTIMSPDGNPLTFYDGSHTGSNLHPDRGEAHGNAITNSATYALRRAAINLGDQFGLSLYNKGSLEPIVRWTLVGDEPADTDDVVQVEAEDEARIADAEAADDAEPVKDERPKPRAARKPVAKKEERPGPVTAQDLALDAFKDVKTTEELRGTWKLAGELGHLKTEITVPQPEGVENAEKLTLEKYLLRRSDELSAPKSDPSGAADPGSSGDNG